MLKCEPERQGRQTVGFRGERIRDTQQGSAEDQLVASTKLTVPRPDSGETELSL